MLKVASEPLELRGVVSQKTKDERMYYLINAEIPDGTAYRFYCPDFNALPQGLNKGDMVRIYFDVRYFSGKERLVVSRVEKVTA